MRGVKRLHRFSALPGLHGFFHSSLHPAAAALLKNLLSCCSLFRIFYVLLFYAFARRYLSLVLLAFLLALLWHPWGQLSGGQHSSTTDSVTVIAHNRWGSTVWGPTVWGPTVWRPTVSNYRFRPGIAHTRWGSIYSLGAYNIGTTVWGPI